MKPDIYSYYVDRYEEGKTGMQIYGTMFTPDEGFLKFKDIKNVDIYRKEIGLCSLKTWLKILGVDTAILPLEYIEK